VAQDGRSTGSASKDRLRWISRYWNVGVGGGALVAVLAFTIVPPWQEYVGAAALVAAFAALAILIDIRVELDQDVAARTATAHPSMRTARGDITTRLAHAIRHGGESTEILIIGGRIRTITDILRDVADQVATSPGKHRRIALKIATMSPSYLEELRLPGEATEAHQRERNRSYAATVRAAGVELRAIAQRLAADGHKITVTVVEYHDVPAYYCFLIDRKELFWGLFTWDRRDADLVGPANPCYFMTAKHADFNSMYDGLSNRFALLEARYGTEPPGEAAPVQQPKSPRRRPPRQRPAAGVAEADTAEELAP